MLVKGFQASGRYERAARLWKLAAEREGRTEPLMDTVPGAE